VREKREREREEVERKERERMGHSLKIKQTLK
jgi:hypothetical protein